MCHPLKDCRREWQNKHRISMLIKLNTTVNLPEWTKRYQVAEIHTKFCKQTNKQWDMPEETFRCQQNKHESKSERSK